MHVDIYIFDASKVIMSKWKTPSKLIGFMRSKDFWSIRAWKSPHCPALLVVEHKITAKAESNYEIQIFKSLIKSSQACEPKKFNILGVERAARRTKSLLDDRPTDSSFT